MSDRKNRVIPDEVISDELWDSIKLLLPPESPQLSTLSPHLESREVMEVILHGLRYGNGWNVMDTESPICEQFQKWCRTGTFDRLWQVGILTHDELRELFQQAQ